jgi:hypothetical protein
LTPEQSLPTLKAWTPTPTASPRARLAQPRPGRVPSLHVPLECPVCPYCPYCPYSPAGHLQLDGFKRHHPLHPLPNPLQIPALCQHIQHTLHRLHPAPRHQPPCTLTENALCASTPSTPSTPPRPPTTASTNRPNPLNPLPNPLETYYRLLPSADCLLPTAYCRLPPKLPTSLCYNFPDFPLLPGEVLELADRTDLGSVAARREGSNPSFPTPSHAPRAETMSPTPIFKEHLCGPNCPV